MSSPKLQKNFSIVITDLVRIKVRAGFYVYYQVKKKPPESTGGPIQKTGLI
jgi:hypothetical protein